MTLNLLDCCISYVILKLRNLVAFRNIQTKDRPNAGMRFCLKACQCYSVAHLCVPIFIIFLAQKANYVGSLTQSSTVCLGTGPDGDVFIPLKDLLPMVHPNDIVFDGK